MSAPLDDRGVSEVLGAVLVFGVVIMLLGMLQTFAVPQENQKVEFQHSQQVADQMADLRATALDVARDGGTKTTNVKLGTSYPTRFVLLNPPDATGTLRTTGAGEVESDGFNQTSACGTDGAIRSRTLEYEPRYNAYDSPPSVGFEHGFTYRKYDDDVRIDNEQSLVRGTTITLLPFVDEYAEEGVEKESIDLSSTGMGRTTITTSSSFTITVPSQLSAETWENDEQLLADEIASGPVDSVSQASNDRIEIELESGTYTVGCSVLGIGSPPAASPPNLGAGGGLTINPSGPGAVIFQNASWNSDNPDSVDITLKNTGSSTRTIDLIRVPFYDSDTQGASTGRPPDNVSFNGGPLAEVGGPHSSVSIDIPSGKTATVRATFSCWSSSSGTNVAFTVGSGDYFVLSTVLDDGDSANYFINPPSTSPGHNPDCDR